MDVVSAFPTLQKMLTGDVNGAFRNIPLSAYHVGRFSGTIPELGILIVDLCCPFGYRPRTAAIGHLYAAQAKSVTTAPERRGHPEAMKTSRNDETSRMTK
jgi:hypothetical protein